MFEYKPDFEDAMDRWEAWWNCQIIDRPLVTITFPRPKEQQIPLPNKRFASQREQRNDTEHFVRSQVAWLHNQVHYAEALPIAYSHAGPETIPAFYGCPLTFEGITAWSDPILKSWDKDAVDAIRFDTNNFYWRQVMEQTDALLEAARGKFIVGYTAFLGAIDTIAALRDPAQLALDLLEHRAEVEALADRLTTEILQIYDIFHEKLSAAGMPSATWWGASCRRGKYYIPSCDFSCMVSDAMFEQIVLPRLMRELRHMDRNIYHLDGERALRYLDRLLEIPEIHAYQWVPTGFGREGQWRKWVHVYQRIQNAGRGFVVWLGAKELQDLFKVLRPEGAWLMVSGVANQDEADAVLKAVARWR